MVGPLQSEILCDLPGIKFDRVLLLMGNLLIIEGKGISSVWCDCGGFKFGFFEVHRTWTSFFVIIEATGVVHVSNASTAATRDRGILGHNRPASIGSVGRSFGMWVSLTGCPRASMMVISMLPGLWK